MLIASPNPRRVARLSKRVRLGIACESALFGEALHCALEMDAIVAADPDVSPLPPDSRITLAIVVASSIATTRRRGDRARRIWPRAKLLAVVIHNREDIILECFARGMRGVVLGNEPLDALVAALAAVHRGDRRLPPSIGYLDRLIRVSGDATPASRAPLARISTRERQILELLAIGKQNKEIAHEFGVELQTVKNSVFRLFRKLGVSNRADAARLAPPRHTLWTRRFARAAWRREELRNDVGIGARNLAASVDHIGGTCGIRAQRMAGEPRRVFGV